MGGDPPSPRLRQGRCTRRPLRAQLETVRTKTALRGTQHNGKPKEQAMTQFVNLNPHPVRLRINAANTAAEPDASDIVVEPRRGADGKTTPARVSTTPGHEWGVFDGIPAYTNTHYGRVEGLPQQDIDSDTIYLVSALIGGRPEVRGRTDVFIPGTGPKDGAVRTAEGQIYAVTRIVMAG